MSLKYADIDGLKSIDDNLRTQPKDYWKYISKFKDNYHSVTQFKIGENAITEP
jgi:hypothetical protein